MNKVIGKCGLCHKTKELRESHFLPASLYKRSREEGRQNPNPRLISAQKAWITPRQVKSYFLCSDCEERFNKFGERYILSVCAKPDSSFELRDRLIQGKQISASNYVSELEISSILRCDIENLIYFPASIFWRASAKTWKDKGRTLRLISLGPYEEELRKYLLGEQDFPKRSKLVLKISSETIPYNISCVPYCSKEDVYFQHIFTIPGLLFIMYVGKKMPPFIQKTPLGLGQRIISSLSKFSDDPQYKGVLNGIKHSKPQNMRHS